MARTLAPGLYVMCYHDIAWAEPDHLRGLGICHPPDRFGEHLALYTELGDIVSLGEGLARLRGGEMRRPAFTLTFDDGYRGVIDHAYPALASLQTTGMVAINYEFLDGRATFWRSQLCWIRREGGLARLASRLEDFGYRSGSVREFTLDHFDEAVFETITSTYQEFAGDRCLRDRESMHLRSEEVVSLRDRGWEVANHSTRHLPLLEETASHAIVDEYESCESDLRALLATPTDYWVAPFDRPLQRSLAAVDAFRKAAGQRSVVLVDDRRTTPTDLEDGVIYRVFPPVSGPDQLYGQLRRAARRTKSPAPHRGPQR